MSEIEEVQYEPIRHAFQEWVDSRGSRAASDMPGYIREAEFARRVNRQVSTVRRWRKSQPPFGPPAARIGNEFYYRENAAAQLLDALMQKAEAAREAPPRRRGRPRGA